MPTPHLIGKEKVIGTRRVDFLVEKEVMVESLVSLEHVHLAHGLIIQ